LVWFKPRTWQGWNLTKNCISVRLIHAWAHPPFGRERHKSSPPLTPWTPNAFFLCRSVSYVTFYYL
jgi:hypothetical protein